MAIGRYLREQSNGVVTHKARPALEDSDGE